MGASIPSAARVRHAAGYRDCGVAPASAGSAGQGRDDARAAESGPLPGSAWAELKRALSACILRGTRSLWRTATVKS